MAESTRVIKRRIKSVQSTKKITKAMELVSAAKMRRAVNAVLSSRPYATLAWDMVSEIGKVSDVSHHPLLKRPASHARMAIICVTSDRGLCSGFNAQIVKTADRFRKKQEASGVACDFIVVGKKGQDAARRMRWNIVAAFSGFSAVPSLAEIQPVAALATRDFIGGLYDSVHLAYTDFISTLKQSPRLRQLLPLTRANETEMEKDAPETAGGYRYEYVFEPSPQTVLDVMLPRLVESQVYQALYESSASEHSARMVAMKNATDSAKEMIDDLAFTYNQARQAAITREIAEISAGKAALE